MRIIRIGLKLKRIFRRGRGRGILKKLALSLLGTAVAIGFIILSAGHIPRVITDMAVLSSAFALPEGTGVAVARLTAPAPEQKPEAKPQPEPPTEETSSEQEAVSDAVIEVPNPPSYEVAESDRGRIIAEKFSSTADKNAAIYGNGTIKNYTNNSIETIEKILKTPWSESLSDDPATPQVLIMHTHTTESYEPFDRDYYDINYSARTLDENFNMIQVGNAIAKILSENGIGVVHDTTVHDYPSYNGSYERSAETVEMWLAKYPTIKVVLDIHRDAIERTVSGETVRVKPVTEIDGRRAAQLMIIAGCDDGTMNMPNWRENLRLAAALQDRLETDSPTLTRPVMFDYRKYNQNLTTGSLLIEMGGHANSLDEAVYSGELLGKSLSSLLKTYMDKNGED